MDEDDPIEDPPERPPVVPERPLRRDADGRPILSADADQVDNTLWWNHKDIVHLITLSITDGYNDYSPNWKETSSPRREAMFNTFKAHVWTDFTDRELRKQYEKAVKSRLTKTVWRACNARKKPAWIPECIYQRLIKRKDNAKFRKISETASKNRCSGGVDGIAPGTHCHGRKSTSAILEELVADSLTGDRRRSSYFKGRKEIRKVNGFRREPSK